MQFFVFFVTDDEVHDYNEKELAELGFRRTVATPDKQLAFQLPYPTFATMREGESREQVRDDVLKSMAKANISGFVLVAEGFSCGRT